MITFELLPNSIRFVTSDSTLYLAPDEFLEFQQRLKEALFEYCRVHHCKLGEKETTHE